MARRHNRTGRSTGVAQFVPLPYAMLRHDAWRSLSGNAVKVWLELRSRYTVKGDGETNNNGKLTLSLDQAARTLHISKGSAARAFAELERAGFVVKTKPGHWYGRKATEWRVTDQPCNGQLATRDWQQRGAENQSSVPRRSMYDANGVIQKPNGG